MTDLNPHYLSGDHPLIAMLDLNRPLSADILRAAIVYEEAQLDTHRKNIEVLQKALARLLGMPPASPAFQESPRRVGAAVE